MFKAVIFDMNGVIVQDELIHQESVRQYCKRHGFNITEEEFKRDIFGRTEKDIFEYLYKRPITPKELKEYSNERVDGAIEIFKPQLKMANGLEALLENLYENNIPMAIATNSRNRYFNFIMDGLGIRKYFKVTVTAEDITKGKPDPEIYLMTAKQLRINPHDCIVFEDTMMGIESAKAAGMKVIAIATINSKEELGIADKVIDSFNEIDLEALNNLGTTKIQSSFEVDKTDNA
ncbi:MAG: HAD family phosphatase [Patescibacteria group bacterium]